MTFYGGQGLGVSYRHVNIHWLTGRSIAGSLPPAWDLPGQATTCMDRQNYLNRSSSEQPRLFADNFNYKSWKKICKKAGLFDLKFHELRKTFGTVLAQYGISTAVTQRLLEHSSPNLTNKVYTNVDTVLRYAIEQIPVSDWL
jgi:integrase